MDQNDITEQHKKLYQTAINKHGNSLKAMHWYSYAKTAKRYKELLIDIDLENRSILDVGCGTGNLLPYIIARCNQFTYQGIDIMPDFITQAKGSYPDFNFNVADFWHVDFKERADVILTCGTLNLAILDIEQRKEMIKKLFNQSNNATAFNMSGQYPVTQEVSTDGLIRYVNALEIFQYCLTLTSKIVFRQHYNPYDFTIVMLHV